MDGPRSEGGLEVELRSRLHAAMRERDRPAMQVLRVALGALANAAAVPDDDRTQTERLAAARTATDVPRRPLREAEVRALVAAELRDREDAAARFRRRGEEDRAATAEVQAGILRRVLGPDPS